jgi:hypothetical protein
MGALVAGTVDLARGKSPGWLKRAAILLTQGLVISLVRPRVVGPSRADCLEALSESIRQRLRHDADLALAWCWAYPRPKDEPAKVETGIPADVLQAIDSLRTICLFPSAGPEDVIGAAEALQQRVEEQGYEWLTVEKGTAYTELLATHFDIYGLIPPGQPVQMEQAAILRRGKVERRGLLRKAMTVSSSR